MRVSDGEERNDASSNDIYRHSDAESSPVEFSVEQEELFQRHFNEDAIGSLTQATVC